ncbi:MgtC/SapB family protein [Paenibacillus sp. SC116]|uniref:MgtC/SapB family protein n=1 Tax=Paenibacillus sp. SC116 TaxID=2968986 RepID=UPI00215ADC55|nr:MgtC/SapB family protein [Paenibacillus sp. SC116]MCR8844921.1 MgtC/SapB family protein [Paenibacillus sp. SC116]
MNPWVIDWWPLTQRLVLAALLGGIIGLERERSRHAAGVRTHMLVSMGSALIMLLSLYGFSMFVDEDNVRMDPARLSAQVISGIGFLGAGTIIRDGLSVKGLTTAASIWVAAAIGLSVGAGFYYGALLTCVLTIIALWLMNKMEFQGRAASLQYTFRIRGMDDGTLLPSIRAMLATMKVEVDRVEVTKEISAQARTVWQKSETVNGTNVSPGAVGVGTTGTGVQGAQSDHVDGVELKETVTMKRQTSLKLEVVIPPKVDAVDVVERLAAMDEVLEVRGK